MSAKTTSSVVRLTETGVMLALGTVLSLFPFYQLPYGGSITLAAMLPMLIIAYRHGSGWGFFAAGVYGLIQALLGASNFGYVPGFAAFICILLFDYFIAFAAMCLGGTFRKLPDPAMGLSLGALCACAARYLCHVISGCTVWASAPFVTDGAAIVYSVSYNASYMLPETIVTVAAAWWLGKQLDFRKPKLGAAVRERAKTSVAATVLTVIGSLLLTVTIAFDLICLTVAFMGALAAAGFDSAAFTLTAVTLPWKPMLIVTAVGGVISTVLLLVARRVRKNRNVSRET